MNVCDCLIYNYSSSGTIECCSVMKFSGHHPGILSVFFVSVLKSNSHICSGWGGVWCIGDYRLDWVRGLRGFAHTGGLMNHKTPVELVVAVESVRPSFNYFHKQV